MNIIASLIIPSHNRSASLKKMLQGLELQSYSKENFEVIVVADGCRDNTVEMVKNFNAEFHLIVCELPGLGAATARNTGASIASGKYLILADDDMELSAGFIKEHIASHTGENSVVIGYSPFKLESKASIQRLSLREWWEEKFQAMRNKGHRFRYEDLTSGNFSISNNLFKKLNGFDTAFLCREDYEFGFRLIEEGAEFHFAYTAKAFHCDEVTNLRRSLQRKKSEGSADVQFKNKHPQFSNKEAIFYLSQRSFTKSVLLKAIKYTAPFCDGFANLCASLMHYFEKFQMHSSWLKMNYRLHQYWYVRGLMASVRSAEEFRQYITDKDIDLNKHKKQVIDLQQGLKKVQEALDESKPFGIDIYYGPKFIGSINYEPGAERIKGAHLRKILKDKFSEELASTLFPEQIFKIH
jgi:glycosyltransferase involved in cell wall biosynthesis